MTKVRPPLSIDLALARIADELPGGWAEMAAVVGRAETTVRKLRDEAQPEKIPLPAAIALDIAFERAGGMGHPLFQTYALQLELAREQAFACETAILRQTAVMIRESGEAHEAMVLASLPSASAHERATAIRELEDVVREASGTIAMLKQPRARDGATPPSDAAIRPDTIRPAQPP